MASYYNSTIIRPFIVALLLLNSTSSSSSKRHTCLPEQQNALLQFKEIHEIENYEHMPSWQNDTDCCMWDGVTCDTKTGYVISLDISYRWPQGTINNNSPLFLLQNLQSLHLSHNGVNGSLSSFTQLPNLLHLDLSTTNVIVDSTLNGTINNSSSVLPLQNLQSLYLSNNALSGSLDFLVELSSLKHLDLSWNEYSGIVPPEIAHLSQLISLDISGNNLTFTSSILELLIQNLTQLQELNLAFVGMDKVSASSLLNMSSTLTSLTVSYCGLRGRFPDYIFHLPNLHFLDLRGSLGLMGTLPKLNWTSPLIFLYLSSTGFSGNMPNSIGNLKNLERLDLSSCHFTNLIPPSICSLSSLQVLILSENTFTGLIPQCLGSLTNLFWLDMSHNQLTGPLPRSLTNSTLLQSLNATSNMLSDTFPFWLGFLPDLTDVDLGQNRFYGSISRLFTAPSLDTLILRQNNFSGHLPDFDGYIFLTTLDLSNNNLEGPIPKLPDLNLLLLSNNNFTGEIPLSICKLSPSVLDLSNNSLTGTIPPCLLNDVYVLNLGMNKLGGAIPDIFTANTSITALDLSNNQLARPLPRSMVNCKELVLLDLSNNNIEDSFPNWLGALPILQVLLLQSNRFNGKLKTLMAHPFPSLRLFDVSNNNLTGFLPIEYISQLDAMKKAYISQNSSQYLDVRNAYADLYGYFFKITLTMKGSRFEFPKISVALVSMDFSNNNFQGEVPEVIGELVALKGLNLSHNNLTGNIPLSIQNLTSLEWLDLSSNKFNGLIPNGLTHLRELSSLNLSYNVLRGMIPRGQQFDTFGMESFVGNTGLCGSQVAKACGELNIPEQPQPPLSPTEEDDFNACDWKIISMGYGCGLVIGISIEYIVFELRTPGWLVTLVEEKLLRKIARLLRWRK